LVISDYTTAMMLDDIDLDEIQEENARQLVWRLLNLIEDLSADLRDAQIENQGLRDEVNRLKGEQGKPNIKANRAKPARSDYSSEKERRKSRPRKKRNKKAAIRIDREQVLKVEPSSLPADAEFKGYEDVVVQDVVFRTDNVCFHKEKYHATSTGKSYLAELPRGYEGEFGPGIKALTLTLYFGAGISEPKILELYADAGVQISKGEVSQLLIKGQEAFHAEKEAVYEAGLRSSPWQHIDDTGTRVNGQNWHCHIVCNPLYTLYHTLSGKDRLSVLDVLRQGRERVFRLNEEALGYLTSLSLPQAARQTLLAWCDEQDLDEEVFLNRMDTHLPKLGRLQRKAIIDAAAVAAYHAEAGVPLVRLLVCDDAPQFKWLTEDIGLCWVHEGRHYKKLTPAIALHRQQLVDFVKQFWDFYKQMLAYQRQPSPQERCRLEAEFDRLFSTVTGYAALDARIAKTREKKASLLMALQHPEIPLHNNPAEWEVRRRVRKRDVSFGPRTADGVRAWDTFMSLAATTRKLGISFYQYIHDRISKANQIPPLASLIETRANDLALGASWSTA
jgi:hypothetical protein